MKQCSHYLPENQCRPDTREETLASWQEQDTRFSQNLSINKSNRVYLATNQLRHCLRSHGREALARIHLPNSQGGLAKQRSQYLPENPCRRHSRRNSSQLAEARCALFSKPVKPGISCYKPVKVLFTLAWSRGTQLRLVPY